MSGSVTFSRYSFGRDLLFRTPAYSYLEFSGKNWTACLEDAYFVTAISIASPSLYRQLSGWQVGTSELSPKAFSSLWKYCNRMRYRPTPFGLCAGFSVTCWQEEDTGITLSKDTLVYRQPDFVTVLKESAALLDLIPALSRYFIPNPSLYVVHDHYRYLRYKDEQQKRTFRIEALPKDGYLDCLLQEAVPATIQKLSDRLARQFAFSGEECTEYVQSLIDAQVVVPVLQPGITGENYLQSLPEQITAPEPSAIPVYKGNREDLDHVHIRQADNRMYINMERPVLSGGLSGKYKQAITDGLACLERLVPPVRQQGLEDFKTKFRKKYDRQCVPLLQAMDPEAGIGYQGLGAALNTPAILRDMPVVEAADTTTQQQHRWSAVHALLMQKWSTCGTYNTLQLTEADFQTLEPGSLPVPNTCSALFRILGDGIYLEQAGGATATAVAGRFTPLNESVYEIAREAAIQEERANPEILFAELAYISDLHTANIDRRRQLYTYEIPILCGSSAAPEQQLPLNDLWISVEGDEIILWSKKHNRRVIPRLSSAFNYLRSNLAIFRFLCDLQYQGIRSELSLNMNWFFPGLRFYPRVQYKKTVLHLATWTLDSREFPFLFAAGPSERLLVWEGLRQEKRMPRYLSLDEYDNQLVFDLDDETDTQQLLSMFQAQKKLILREFICRDKHSPLVKDENGTSYIHQFVAPLCHSERVYRSLPFPVHISEDGVQVRRIFTPGSEWLYYKLYIHPVRSNELIREYLIPSLHQLKACGLAKQWFFIRYGDPEYHLRLRINLHPKLAGYVLHKLGQAFNGLAESGIIQSYMLDTYERELERYTSRLIEDCENFFCASTSLVSNWLESGMAGDDMYEYYSILPFSSDLMLQAFGYTPLEAAGLFEQLYKRMMTAISGDAPGATKKHARLMYEALKPFFSNRKPETRIYPKSRKAFLGSLQTISGKCGSYMDAGRKQILFADLLHMHLNRLLVTDSLNQEMILYYCLWKHYASKPYRQT